ncbi:MAG TPA: glycosyltransferase family 4 protein [Gaiellales bacterium]|nr:glycosyltransferase family 4 protein [Gaiellales bacterium]
MSAETAAVPARVLMVNKFHYPRGGAEHYMFRLAGLLKQRGTEVDYFAMRDARNLPCPTDRYFVSEVSFEQPPQGLSGRIGMAGRMVYSREARSKMGRLLADRTPDLAHVHNIYHQLSPSLLAPLRRRGVPVVMTVHDFKLVCPVYSLLSHGEICERCVSNGFGPAVRHRCNRGSLSGSLLVAGETWAHRRLGLYRDGVDVFITPSAFARDRLITGGYPAERIVVVPNCVVADDYHPLHRAGDHALYVGRLSREKGVEVLVRAAAASGARVKMVGDGPLRPTLERMIAESGADVELLGFRSGEELSAAVQAASAVVMPSICHDNCPLAVIEAMAWGKPVIGSRVGGIPELVRDGEEGLLVPHGDTAALGAAMLRLQEDPELAERMGRAGRARVEAHYDAGPHYRAVAAAYRLAAEMRRAA